MNSGDIGFMLICSALVLLMTPGLAFFYGGLVRRKNVVNTMMTSVFVIGIAAIMWALFGYSLAFGNDHFGIIGDFSWLGLQGIEGSTTDYVSTIPHLEFAIFQMMFAIITPALITGAVAGRMKFKALFLFIILWSVIVYYPMAHMVWGLGGFLAKIGSIDFAGGNVVHISSGVSALVLCIVLGKRKDYLRVQYHVHNIPFVVLGASLLLFGWFGFNAGSALQANELAVHAFMTTGLSAAAGMLSWMGMDVWMSGKPTLVGSVTGMVVGLVAITPGAGYVPIWASIIIGLVGSPICYLMISKVKQKLGYDDALDAFGCHGIGGIWGGIATGLFTQTSINDVARWNGLFFGDTQLFIAQIISIVVTIAVAIIGTLICIAIVRCFTTLRVSKQEEQKGLDISEHQENAYPSFNGLD
ncbi:ammonium transporter [Massilimicrobiota timonensis]|uniref:Ammonium transporter n=1 Tax=Massilimicrobiota timonensis TaxID=1776392 RepID=A0ABT7UHU3_9FIRM|nr:ammonium transporter [Massilimicrobiota timonensis]MDM8195497.1 ammonium transporter [Massilimicrobiota timonensis]